MIDLSSWPALVLTAGLATRLRPLSEVRAKGAMPVAGEALVARILRWLRAAGVGRVVLNLHHRPETITRVVGDGAEWGVDVRYSWERELLGSAGGPKQALPLLDADRFLIVNGDTLTDCDLRAVTEQHVHTGALVTMALVEKEVRSYAFVDDNDVVAGFGAKKAAGPFFAGHFIGVQAVDTRAFDEVPAGARYETVNQLYPHLIQRHAGSVRGFRSNAEFLDVGTPADYFETVDIICRREAKDFDRGRETIIHPSANVRRSVLWDRVRVLEQAQLIDCIVGDDVVIPAGARYQRSAIVSGASGLVVSPF